MASHSAVLAITLSTLACLSQTLAVGTPFGLASDATGGGSATPATPSSNDELASWLSDDTARVIVLDKIYDFTDAEGTTSETGCAPWTCTPNPQASSMALENVDDMLK